MQKTDDILTADFETEYEINNATADGLIFMGGRKTVSLDVFLLMKAAIIQE